MHGSRVGTAFKVARSAGVIAGLIAAALTSKSPAVALQILMLWLVLSVAGLTAVEGLFFASEAASRSGYVPSGYQRQSACNNLALALTAILSVVFGWGGGRRECRPSFPTAHFPEFLGHQSPLLRSRGGQLQVEWTTQACGYNRPFGRNTARALAGGSSPPLRSGQNAYRPHPRHSHDPPRASTSRMVASHPIPKNKANTQAPSLAPRQ